MMNLIFSIKLLPRNVQVQNFFLRVFAIILTLLNPLLESILLGLKKLLMSVKVLGRNWVRLFEAVISMILMGWEGHLEKVQKFGLHLTLNLIRMKLTGALFYSVISM